MHQASIKMLFVKLHGTNSKSKLAGHVVALCGMRHPGTAWLAGQQEWIPMAETLHGMEPFWPCANTCLQANAPL